MSINRIHLTVKSVIFFAMQKNRPFLRQVMRALVLQAFKSHFINGSYQVEKSSCLCYLPVCSGLKFWVGNRAGLYGVG